MQCLKKGEQYAFVTVWTQGHTAKLDDTLWVQVQGRGGQGDVGEEEGGKEQTREGRCDSERSEHRTD